MVHTLLKPELCHEALGSTQAQLRELSLSGRDDEMMQISLPSCFVGPLLAMVEAISLGKSVSIISVDAQLTTQEAADMLNVSRPYLIKLLNNQELPHTKVGRHRRIALEDVLAYKEQREQKRDEAMNQLVDLSDYKDAMW